MFSIGAFTGWTFCIAMAAWAGKQMDKWIADLEKNPIKVTEN
jgi:hypothetical protein